MIKKSKSVVLFLAWAFSALIWFPTQGWGGRDPSSYHIKYLKSIDGVRTGQALNGVNAIYIDEESGELYILDAGNGRVVITDLAGVPLFSFRIYKEDGPGSFSCLTVDKKGRILLSGGKDVAIFDYKGVFKSLMDLSTIPDRDSISIQSIAVDKTGHIYLGSGGGDARIIELDPDGRFIGEIKSSGRFLNVIGLKVGDVFTFLDSGYYKVLQLDRTGEVKLSFGMLSSLLGGFSMPTYLALDNVRGSIYVVDTNRLMVIAFDMTGKALFEFGGPQTFRWPRVVAVNKEGLIYVGDGTDTLRVFEVKEEALSLPAPPPPPVPVIVHEPVPVTAPVEPQVDEVTEIVTKERRLLPIFFDIDSFSIKEEDRVILDKNIQWLKQHTTVAIMIRGYTDRSGSYRHNYKLSEKRAKAVMEFFKRQGIDPTRMSIIPMGIDEANGTSEEDRRESRRVDFLVK